MKESFPKRRTENYLVKKELGRCCHYVKINFAPLDFVCHCTTGFAWEAKLLFLVRSEGNVDLGCNIERQRFCSFVGFLIIRLCVSG